MFFIVRVKYPAKHREHFLNIERFFKDRLDITIDPKCINENRLRYQSYNTPETSWFNKDAPKWKSRIKIERRASSADQPKGETAERVKKCIDKIVERELDITSGENWVPIGCAFINEFGEAGRHLFNQVSQFHAKYDPVECDTKYSYWMKRGYPYTIRTFFYICKVFEIVCAMET